MKIKLYRCDPDKYKNCPKTMCYRNGGPCKQTLNPQFALTIKDVDGSNVPYEIEYLEVEDDEGRSD